MLNLLELPSFADTDFESVPWLTNIMQQNCLSCSQGTWPITWQIVESFELLHLNYKLHGSLITSDNSEAYIQLNAQNSKSSSKVAGYTEHNRLWRPGVKTDRYTRWIQGGRSCDDLNVFPPKHMLKLMLQCDSVKNALPSWMELVPSYNDWRQADNYPLTFCSFHCLGWNQGPEYELGLPRLHTVNSKFLLFTN